MTKSCQTIKVPSFAIIPDFLCRYSCSSGTSLGRSPVEQQKNYKSEFILVYKDIRDFFNIGKSGFRLRHRVCNCLVSRSRHKGCQQRINRC